jgi:hypothetical protein
MMDKLREKSLEWFFAKSADERIDLKNKHYPSEPIAFREWGFDFTFGQIEKMYLADSTHIEEEI